MQYSSTLSLQSCQRKINRLQIQNINLKQQLQTIILKTKSLQQIQIKYQLLLGQSQNENQHLKLNEYMLQKKLQQQIQSIIQQKDQQNRQIIRKIQQQHKSSILQFRDKHKQQLLQQQQKYNQLKHTYQSLLSKSSQIDIFAFKLKKYQKLNIQLEEQLESLKLLSQQTKQKQLTEQKNTLTKKLKLKYHQQIETYQQKLKQLNKKINQLQLENDILNQKNKNLQLSQQTSNIQKLKQILSQRKSIQKNQLTKLQQALDRANNSLRKMVQQKYQTEQKYITKQDQMKKYIKDVESQLLQQQKTHTREIFALQQKMKTIKEEEISTLNSHIEAIKNQFQQQKKIWNDLSQSHKQQLNDLQQLKTKQWTEYEQQKQRLKQKIKQLTKQLQQHEGKKIQSQTQQIIQSFKDIDQKQDTQSKYQNGLIFLQRQLKKANITIDQKNQQISRLLKEQTNLREQTQQEVNQWRQRYTQQKKQLMDRVFQLENQVRDLSDKIRLKDKQLQKSQKQTSFQKIQLQKRIQALQDINQQLKKDYERMVVANKAIQAEYRGQRDRGVSAVGDVTYAKRMKWLQLEKQKNELSIVFREKEQQLKIIYEKQIDQLRKQRDTFKQKSTLQQDQKNALNQEYQKALKKIDNKENFINGGVSGKKKSGDMEKKLASLNLQIALTKNLFENLQKAKSRLKSRQLTERVVAENMNQQQFD